MSVNEASMLVLETAFLSNSGIYVLDMGEEVELFEISKRLMNILGREVPINITGLRPGEKLSEELVSSNEILEKTSQSKISYLQFASKSTWKDSEMNIPNNNVDSREKIDSLLEKLELGLSIESE
jgi:FlaA1/EpsC-like NDP-sugar epimerase